MISRHRGRRPASFVDGGVMVRLGVALLEASKSTGASGQLRGEPSLPSVGVDPIIPQTSIACGC
jgi:hypothetical protein